MATGDFKMSTDAPTYTIIQADGLYRDEKVEEQIFAAKPGQNYKVDYKQLQLFPTGSTEPQPWTSIPEEVRNKVNGILTLKMYFTADDVKLFPNLKV